MQVWDYRRSAEMRDTEGGASKRSVLEQAGKLKAYLAAEGLACRARRVHNGCLLLSGQSQGSAVF